MTKKRISKKLQPLRKGQYQMIDKPTNVIDLSKKEIVQHRDNLLPYYPKEFSSRTDSIIFLYRTQGYSQ